MKYFLFVILFAFIFSKHCPTTYITEILEGNYNSFFKSCSCPTGTTGIIDPFNETCKCFWKSEIEACKNDPECKPFQNVGCANA